MELQKQELIYWLCAGSNVCGKYRGELLLECTAIYKGLLLFLECTVVYKGLLANKALSLTSNHTDCLWSCLLWPAWDFIPTNGDPNVICYQRDRSDILPTQSTVGTTSFLKTVNTRQGRNGCGVKKQRKRDKSAHKVSSQGKRGIRGRKVGPGVFNEISGPAGCIDKPRSAVQIIKMGTADRTFCQTEICLT